MRNPIYEDAADRGLFKPLDAATREEIRQAWDVLLQDACGQAVADFQETL